MSYTNGLDNPELYFQCKLYTGNGSSGTAITFDGSENMQPDFIWGSCRSVGDNNWMSDSVRGNTKALFSNNSNDEETSSERIKSFDSNGFTIGDAGDTNTNTRTFVTWNWKAGTSFSNDASATGVGSIDSTGSINTTAGFSIISYSGSNSNSSVAHGLSSAVKMIIVKNRSSDGTAWTVGHDSLGFTKRLYLHDNSAVGTNNNFQDTAPTSSVFTLTGNNLDMCQSGSDYIAWCFAPKQGYSKFGSFLGTGSANGAFVYTGFKPAWLMIKKTNSSGSVNWFMFDNKRSPINAVDDFLKADTSDAEGGDGNGYLDFLSNGFKFKTANIGTESGGTFIFMAFAEAPFVNSNGIPNNAR